MTAGGVNDEQALSRQAEGEKKEKEKGKKNRRVDELAKDKGGVR